MSYTLYLGSFQKRVNSTKQPTYSAWASYDVVLKDPPVDYDNPVFLLAAEFASIAPLNYNYAVVWGRFYWITGIKAVRTNLIEISLAFDVLASNKSDIMATKAFIEYGANTFDASDSATRIADARRPVNRNPSVYTASASLTGGALSAYGSYIMQVVSAQGGVSCFAVTYTQLQAIMLAISSDLTTDIGNITAQADPVDSAKSLAALVDLMGEGYKQSLLAESALAAIKSIHWLPLAWSDISGTSTAIYLGTYATGQNGKLLNTNALWTHTGSINIPWPVSDWKRNNIQMSLYVPFFGTVPVPIDQCINNASIAFTLSLDLLGGDLSVRITSGSQTIYTGSTNLAAPYAVGVAGVAASAKTSGGIQIAGGALQAASGVIDAGASMYTAGLFGGGVAQGIGNALSGTQTALSGYAQTIQPLITSAGSMGGIAALGQSMDLILTLFYFAPLTDTEFDNLYGHPVFKVDTPVAGFCKTRGFSFEGSEEAKYAAYINAILDGGCYIE